MPADVPQVSVVVPLYNEEENVPELQRQLTEAMSGFSHELIFVDDGSSDATATRVEMVPGVRLLRFAKNSGQSAAMYAGIMAARGAVVAMLDGDLQNDPADIPTLVRNWMRAMTSCAATGRIARTPPSSACRAASPTRSAAAS